MKLKMLIKDMDIESISGDTDIEISGIAYDSRKVREGNVFVAMRGEKADGHNFIENAVKKGAAAVVSENNPIAKNSVILIKVSDSRKALAYISNNFYQRPSEQLSLIGITGTNGKTTTTYLIKAILEAWGRTVGLIGTINYIVKNKAYDAPHTTPESPEFQEMLREMLDAGCSHVVTEVSSHALAQSRIDYTKIDVALFTNLTQDHLDYHITMQEYYKAKERLFSELLSKNGTAVINIDDAWGMRLTSVGRGNLLTYGIKNNADLVALNIEDSFEGLRFDIRFKDMDHLINSPLVGIHNVYNILSAVGSAIALGIPWDVIKDGIRKMNSVKGRFEKIDIGQGFLCIVDYAHTEDALERLVSTARDLIKGSGKIITVFGCGGNRDRGKRPKMGEVATRLSDRVVITSDNPRYEDPEEIIKEIEAGVVNKNYEAITDRKEAIKRAVEISEPGDILLVAGKGHEEYQDIKGTRHAFSDREVIENEIRDKLKNG